MLIRNGTLTFYKSIGAAQFTLLPVRRNAEGYVEKEGAILIEAAPGNGDKNNPAWDWSKKITFAISTADIANLIDVVNPRANRIFHEHGSTPKTLEFKPGEGKYEGTYQLLLAQGKDSARTQLMVPLTNGEHGVIMRLLIATLPKLIGWE